MNQNLSGKTILVTGASGGLGLHFARTLAADGAHVILAARRLDKVEAAAKEIAESGGSASAVALDVTDKASIDVAFAGPAANVDAVVNNAGISIAGAALDLTEEDFDAVIDTNLKGVFLVAQAAARAMNTRGQGGSIVNIASVLGLRVAGHLSSYCASKAGVVQMTKALALEWARYGIRVNAICPGYFQTEINAGFFDTPAGEAMMKRIPQRRIGQLSDLDAPLKLLCSDGSGYMTGSVIAVDGGHLVSSM
ncbi:SDR family NAD(P)-dependent oxidoreductase [Actibacterium lipolyticum]|uniref:Gluconate 5-dehydrogenase n=1 Tax=Actibacterium lipolyticum TaxID=1524263 RepID=A0A238KPW9_9RHOB|nr:SDR family oxidoreductase [Actibacterium lipolyticum]SMX44152.1 Gluconate 5-dehydrogenase [Actibacterium lipolyticum]